MTKKVRVAMKVVSSGRHENWIRNLVWSMTDDEFNWYWALVKYPGFITKM